MLTLAYIAIFCQVKKTTNHSFYLFYHQFLYQHYQFEWKVLVYPGLK